MCKNINSSQQKLLNLLNDQQWHSGEILGEQLNISRSAVWKLIHSLRQIGIEINSMQSTGYQLAYPLEMLDQNKIIASLQQQNSLKLDELIIFQLIDSTNNYLMSHRHQFTNKVVACLAEGQSQGRARRGRSWLSPFGAHIYCSLLYHFFRDPSELMGLSCAISCAILHTLKEYGINEGLSLKWPNDILWNGKKLSGVLIELAAESHVTTDVIIGIGINGYLTPQQQDLINQPCTGLADFCDLPLRRNDFVILLLKNVINTVENYAKNGLTHFLDIWHQHDFFMDKHALLCLPNQIIQGKALGINELGQLRFESNSQIMNFHSGEISLKSFS